MSMFRHENDRTDVARETSGFKRALSFFRVWFAGVCHWTGKWNIRFISGTGKALRLKAQEKFLSISRLSAEMHSSFTHSHSVRVCVVWVGIGIGSGSGIGDVIGVVFCRQS
jgi:hypothetical protein